MDVLQGMVLPKFVNVKPVAPVVQFVASKPSDVGLEFVFMVDERKKRLNPSGEKNKGKYRRRKVENPVWPSSYVTLAGASTSLASRMNGVTTHIHTA